MIHAARKNLSKWIEVLVAAESKYLSVHKPGPLPAPGMGEIRSETQRALAWNAVCSPVVWKSIGTKRIFKVLPRRFFDNVLKTR